MVVERDGLVDRDRDRRTPGGHADQLIVGGQRAVLDRPGQVAEPVEDQLPDRLEALGAPLGGNAVLHLRVPVVACRRDDLVAPAPPLPLGHLVDLGDGPVRRADVGLGRQLVERLAGAEVVLGDPEELEVAGGGRQPVDLRHDLTGWGEPLALVEPVPVPDPQPDPGDESDPAERVAGDLEQLRLRGRVTVDDVAARGHEPDPGDGRAEVLEARPGAVGPGRDGAGHRLAIDVPLVDEPEPEAVQGLAQLVDPGPRSDRNDGPIGPRRPTGRPAHRRAPARRR